MQTPNQPIKLMHQDALNSPEINPYNKTQLTATTRIATTVEAYRQVKRKIAALNREADALKKEAILFLGDYEELLDSEGLKIAQYAHDKRRDFNKKLFEDEMPRLYAQYLIVKEVRRFL